MPKNLYFGIDLGTTNSVAAWGQEDKNGKFITKTVELRVLDEKKVPRKKHILPSCVYFSSKGEPPIVGEYARKMLSTQSRRVVKSVKSSMGTSAVFTPDEQEHTPAEISSIILRQIANSAKEFNLGTVPNDAVITVPASFDPDQKEATYEAARLAGFRVTEDDGSPRDILLNEPTAALYDFLNRQDNGETSEILDLSSPKVILVYDLGGGTLDVSIHLVSRNTDRKSGTMPYIIQHYAISRHTLLGGDNFDSLLQKFFMSKMKGVDFDSMDELRADMFRSEFLDAAEHAKLDLNSEVETYRMQGEDYEGLSCDVLMNYIANTELTFEYTLTVDEYRKIMEPYLAPDLTMKSLENIDALAGRTDNIIYPILDTLNKARLKPEIGRVPKIDAVLLNGGMSKLFAVRERIEEFFGFPPLEVGDPDLAVARGASVYHYWRHLGIKTPEIQNDDIGIEIQGGTLQKLIFAGANLPFRSEKITLAIPEDKMSYIDLPFYKGTRPDIMPPNKQIASRRIRFETPYAANTPIELQAFVDNSGTLRLNVWDPAKPDLLFPVANINPDHAEPYVAPVYIAPPGGFKKKEAPVIMQTGETVNITELMRRYTNTGQAFSANRIPSRNRQFTDELKEIEAKIESASNSGEAVSTMAGIMTKGEFIADRAARMLGRLARVSAKKYADKAVQALENFCLPEKVKTNIFFNSRKKIIIQSHAVQALSMLRRPEHEKFFLSIMKLKPLPNVLLKELCYALGRTGYSSEAAYAAADCINSPTDGEKIPAYWALGRITSRERPDKCPASCLEDILPSVFRFLRTENHPNVLMNGVYAIGEMCDQRIPGEKVSGDFVKRAEDFLYDLSDRIQGRKPQAENFIRIALNMIQGEELSIEQKRNLLALRIADEEN